MLISIWEDDWVIKKDICKSFINNKLGKSKGIGARKCQIKDLNYKTHRKFLIDNHLQGDCKSSIRLGLEYKGKLVSLMAFSKLRLPLSSKTKKNEYELTRFCNLKDYNVIGGASKLFKYFLKTENVNKVHTYSDNMISEGNLYKKLGFEYKHTSRPGYWYVINKVRYHRFNFRKHKLVKMGYPKDKFEHEIMEELGYYRVFSAGNKKWIYENN